MQIEYGYELTYTYDECEEVTLEICCNEEQLKDIIRMLKADGKKVVFLVATSYTDIISRIND